MVDSNGKLETKYESPMDPVGYPFIAFYEGADYKLEIMSNNLKLRWFKCVCVCGGDNPIGSMYGIFAYIWLTFMVNVFTYIYHTWMVWEWIRIYKSRISR